MLGRGRAARASTLEPAAAQALVAQVGERQQRLLRELEKLALEHGAGRADRRRGGRGRRRAAPPSARSGASSTRWSRATARAATRAFLELRAQGETLPRLVPLMARRVREVLAIADRLEAGESPAQVKARCGEPVGGGPAHQGGAGDRRRGAARALEALADLELADPRASELDEHHAMRASPRRLRRRVRPRTAAESGVEAAA